MWFRLLRMGCRAKGAGVWKRKLELVVLNVHLVSGCGTPR